MGATFLIQIQSKINLRIYIIWVRNHSAYRNKITLWGSRARSRPSAAIHAKTTNEVDEEEEVGWAWASAKSRIESCRLSIPCRSNQEMTFLAEEKNSKCMHRKWKQRSIWESIKPLNAGALRWEEPAICNNLLSLSTPKLFLDGMISVRPASPPPPAQNCRRARAEFQSASQLL